MADHGRLIITGENGEHWEMPLPAGKLHIGRDPQADVCLPDSLVSWRHARITNERNRVLLEDLDSSNGTRLGKQTVNQVRLNDGDVLTIGGFHLEYRAPAPEVSADSASEHTLFAAGPVAGGEQGARPDLLSTRRETGVNATIGRVFPAWKWISAYRREDLNGDVAAGVTIAVMLVPQGMAYAMLAGLPPIMGLYACMLPPLLYALMGSSRQVSAGPVALDSILVAVGVSTLAQIGSENFISMAILLTGMVGLIQVAMGMVRAGFLVNFLSYPVLTGFTTAAAVITAFSQLKHLLGISLPSTHELHRVVIGVAEQAGSISLPTLAIGVLCIVLIIGLKQWVPKAPGPIVAVVVATLLSWLLGLDALGVRIIGAVPNGLPGFAIPAWDMEMVEKLLPLALTLALVGFAETISIAKTLAHKGGYDIDANQELIGVGLANIGGSMTQGYPIAGGLSRSAVNARSGARTQLSSIISAVLVGVSLLFLTPLVYHLPNAALAAIIMVGVVSLIDKREIRYLFKVKRSEGGLLVLTIAATLALGITWGLLVGIIASILLFITLNTRPHAAILGRLPGTDIFRNVKGFHNAQTIDGLVILRIDASFYFANTEFLKAKLKGLAENMGPELRALILDASAVNDLDSSADTALHQIAEDFQKRGISLYIAGVKGPVRAVMKRSGLYDRLGADHFFFTIDAALRRYEQKNGQGGSAKT